MQSPGDMSGLDRLITEKKIDPEHIVAIFGRPKATAASMTSRASMRPDLRVDPGRAPRQHAGRSRDERRARHVGRHGGILSPHATVFCRAPAATNGSKGSKRLAVGLALTRDFLPEELGTAVQIEETARAVKAAMQDAEIEHPDDVHFVQIKCPLLTAERFSPRRAEVIRRSPTTPMARWPIRGALRRSASHAHSAK